MLKVLRILLASFLLLISLVFGIAIIAFWKEEGSPTYIKLFGFTVTTILPIIISYLLFTNKLKSSRVKLPVIAKSEISSIEVHTKASKTPRPEYLLNYLDRHGKLSEREVTVKKVYNLGTTDDTLYMECFCHSANDKRNFRLQNVQRLVEIDSGQLIENPIDFFKGAYTVKNN